MSTEMRFSANSVIAFGVDYLRLRFDETFEGVFFNSLFKGLSLNSPTSNIEVYGIPLQIQFSETRDKKILLFSFFGDSIMTIEKMIEGGKNKHPFNISFYGAFFYIPEVKKILKEVLVRYGERVTVSRIDLCLDVTNTVQNLWENHKTTFQKVNTWKKGEAMETFYLGAKAKNQRHFIRVYNKKLDSQKKGKFHLFLEYLTMDCVSRIEVQINSLSCKVFDITVIDLVEFFFSNKDFQRKKVFKVFQRICLNKSTTCFKTVDMKKVMNKKEKRQIRSAKMLDELQYAKVMVGYARRLNEYGFDVIGYLNEKIFDVY